MSTPFKLYAQPFENSVGPFIKALVVDNDPASAIGNYGLTYAHQGDRFLALTCTIDPFDQRQLVALAEESLRAQITKIQAEAGKRVTELNKQLNDLLMLPAPAPSPVAAGFAFEWAEGLQRFFVTYGSGTVQGNNYTEVWAVDEETARDQIVSRIGAKWSSIYTEETFEERFYPGGSIPLTAHRHFDDDHL